MALKIIYEPKGRAKEYGDLALNIYNGCNFGCKYCYAPLVLKRDRQDFHGNIKLRENFLANVEKDCQKNLIGDRKVHLCFTCDPYQDIDNDLKLTRKVLEILKKHNVNFQILTKGGTRAQRDFDLYKDGDSFGSTLTFVNKHDTAMWEPFAATTQDRIEAIKVAKSMGIRTWVSLEPVIDPQQTLELIRRTHEYVDLYKVGTINYNDVKKTIDWNKFAIDVVELLEYCGKEYYIKEDLKKFST